MATNLAVPTATGAPEHIRFLEEQSINRPPGFPALRSDSLQAYRLLLQRTREQARVERTRNDHPHRYRSQFASGPGRTAVGWRRSFIFALSGLARHSQRYFPSASNPWTGHQRRVAGVWKDMGKSDTEFDDLCKKLQCLPEVTDSMGDHAEIIKGARAGALTHQAQRLARGSIRCRVPTDMLSEIPSGWDNGQG